MTRGTRSDEPGAIHHVYGRGNHKQPIFAGSKDRRRFLRKLRSLKRECGFKVLALCLMGNHYHLLIQTGPVPLAKVMHRLLTSFSRRLNDTIGGPGHVFQGRYSRKRCESQAYLSTLMAYIHLNPVKAGLVKRAEQWPWSGHSELMSDTDGIIDRKEALALLPGGLDDYLSALDAGYKRLARLNIPSTLPELCIRIDALFQLGKGDLQGPGKQRRLTLARRRFVEEALIAGFSKAAIARFLKKTRGAISQLSAGRVTIHED